MRIQTRGIILKQTKLVNDKKIITVFTERYGKVSAVANNDTGRNRQKSSLVYKPFTLGNYELYKNKDIYRMGRGETYKSFYKIGEDVDKYFEASNVLEFTDKLLIEDEPAPGVFSLLSDYFEIMERRTKEYSFLTMVYKIKALQMSGYMPVLDECVACGKKNSDFMFFIEGGGAICCDCCKDKRLIYKSQSDIIKNIAFIAKNSIHTMEKMYLDKERLNELNRIIRGFTKYHLDISNLKSEQLIENQGKDDIYGNYIGKD